MHYRAGECILLTLTERALLPRTGSVWGSRCRASSDERFLWAHYAELVSLRAGKDSPGVSAGLADVDPACPKRKEAVDLLIAVRGAGGEVKMHAVLDRLGVGDRHETHADGCILVGPDDDLVLALGQDLPAKYLRPEPRQAGQIVSVNDEAVESDGHAESMRGTLDRIPETRCSAADGSVTGGHATR